eukprot:15347639-Alexandrium_andersonii.AAC.1
MSGFTCGPRVASWSSQAALVRVAPGPRRALGQPPPAASASRRGATRPKLLFDLSVAPHQGGMVVFGRGVARESELLA